MEQIRIYEKDYCPYCKRAKKLLDQKSVKYSEIDISDSKELLEEMLRESGGRKSVPQIFIGEKHIGGCDDLYEMEASGELDKLLSSLGLIK